MRRIGRGRGKGGGRRKGPRRPFGRGPRLPKRGHAQSRPLNPRLQKELRRANHLMSKGEHINAASIFLSLAARAQDRGILQPASMLFLQAAYAYILAGDIESGLKHSYQGLEIIESEERWPALNREGQRLSAAMQEAGYQNEADDLHAWLSERLDVQSLHSPDKPDQSSHVALPEKCPYCGASMSLEQLNAGGTKAAECHYCASVVLPTQID